MSITGATQSLIQGLQADELYTKNRLSKITGLHFTKIKNLLIASGYDPDEKEYKGELLKGNFVRAVEYAEAGKTLEDIKEILNVATNGHYDFVPEEEVYTPEDLNKMQGKRDKLIQGIAEQLAGDVFGIIAGTDENDIESVAQEIAGQAKQGLDRRLAGLQSLSKRLFLDLI